MPSEDRALQSRLETAIAVAREAGDSTLPYYQAADLRVDLKPDETPVTVADRAAEDIVRSRLGQSFPDDGIVGEELGETTGSSDFTWYVDPIDGTASFVSGVPLYSTLVGLVRGSRPVAGVAYFPALHEICYAVRGGGAWWGRGVPTFEGSRDLAIETGRARVSAISDLAAARFVHSGAHYFASAGHSRVLERLLAATRQDRTWGDAYGYVLVATGRAEVMADGGVHGWDVVPMQIIVEEAGGTFTDFAGVPSPFNSTAIASNGRVHKALLTLISGWRASS